MGSRRKALGAAGLIVALVAVAGSAAYATIPQPNGTYTACYLKSTGAVRVIDAATTTACKSTETKIQWSKTGPAGPKGPQGEPGPASNEDPVMNDIGVATFDIPGRAPIDVPFASFAHEVVSPRDPASGLATGKRQHKPVTIHKEWDAHSPLLLNALFGSAGLPTTLPSATFSVKHDAADATPYMIVTLEDAVIGSYRQFTTSPQELEEISFTYSKIIWTYVDGGVTAEDDWEQPPV